MIQSAKNVSLIALNDRLRNGIALGLLPQLLFVFWLSGRPDLVETYYSNGVYPVVSRFFRILFGWIPFSVGEILYTLLIALALGYLFGNRTRIKNRPLSFLRNLVLVFSVFYFTFHLGWALNYHRMPLADRLGIRDSVTPDEVIDLTQRLITKTNRLQFEITGDSAQRVDMPFDRDAILDQTVAGYGRVQGELPFLAYPNPSLKKATLGALASYMGIGGYFNPFTNEAQVNGRTPLFRLPVVTAHEIGHQVGYAKENETNFIGYLVTMKNEDVHFQYSASAYALSHCLSAVRRTDAQKFEKLFAKVNVGVQENYKELYEFNLKYANPFEPVFKSVFSTFLKANRQKDGIKSYSKIVELMVGYHEKFPIFILDENDSYK
ncbi:DUF3810 domain-containing protein [Pricia sp. S334]|uniref:DUF3810 domain-containing protein n=1 Tax=Pricia mediterranea TaxID=3076079 RepID=A0ABU3L8B4_9FLAO|nr:DUF3810 domain-containing protein [Pricia sp. S334]MDT7829986.1 DUF3810 domain-containing protein [Pricia sp. S334]